MSEEEVLALRRAEEELRSEMVDAARRLSMERTRHRQELDLVVQTLVAVLRQLELAEQQGRAPNTHVIVIWIRRTLLQLRNRDRARNAYAGPS